MAWTPEDRARAMLRRITGRREAYSAGEVVELANLIHEHAHMLRLLKRAEDAIPAYTDGRHDRLLDDIGHALERHRKARG